MSNRGDIMCMIYAFSGKSNYVLNSNLKKFFSFSSFHPHGWGLAAYNDKKELRIIKDKGAANKSDKLRKILNKSIATKLAVAHIRYATEGKISYENAHPFSCDILGEQWVFAHNGSIEDTNVDLYIRPVGETDSEKVFCYIQQKLIESVALGLGQKIKIIDDCIKKFSKGSKLNLVITDGTHLFTHCNYKNSLYIHQTEKFVCFATKPLISNSGEVIWTQVELNKLMVFKDGNKLYESEGHENEFFKSKKVI